MKEKPLFLTFMSAYLLISALMFPIQICYLFDLSIFDITLVLSKLTPLNLISMLFLAITGIFTLKLNKHLFVVLPILNIAICLNNYVVAEYGQMYSHLQTGLSSLFFLTISLGFYRKDIRKVIEDKKFRYWMTPKREMKQIPIEIECNGRRIKSHTYDISKTGLFIIDKGFGDVFNLPYDALLTIRINLKRPVLLRASVARKTLAKGTYPQGIGIKFESPILN